MACPFNSQGNAPAKFSVPPEMGMLKGEGHA
jgi:hypothetical protein